MANLITEKQKKIFKTDYYLRLFSLSILMSALLGAFVLAYVIPYFISVSKKDLLVAEKFQSVISAENKENIGESVSKIVGQVLDELKTIELSGGDQVSPSLYFSRIIENKNPDIKISRLSFDLVSSKNIELLVGGVSKNREGLVTFIEDLKSKAGFKNIEMPVSEFAKDSDVPFTLHIDIIL